MFERSRLPGFTLIEIVVVLTIFAILAAFAVPRFATLEEEARAAATQALAGTIRSSSALSHALWLAHGQPPSITLEGATIVMVNGYPDRRSIPDTLADPNGFRYDEAKGVFSKSGAPGECTVTYAEAISPGIPPTVGVVLEGC